MLASATHHKLDLNVIRDVFQASEADRDLVLGVVQIAQVEHDDVIAFLQEGGERHRITDGLAALRTRRWRFTAHTHDIP